MLGLFLFLMLVTYCPAAVWAQRTGGLLRLWGLCALTLFAIIAFSLAASRVYSVPSSGRVVVYALTLLGPAVSAPPVASPS